MNSQIVPYSRFNEEYNNFVSANFASEPLEFKEYVVKKQLPLNEKYALALEIHNIKDNDWIELTDSLRAIIGFQIDPLVNKTDVNQVISTLRSIKAFTEGPNADFFVENMEFPSKTYRVWVRFRVFDRFAMMTNTENGNKIYDFLQQIREYKNEYQRYLTVYYDYCEKQEMNVKIAELNDDVKKQAFQMEQQNHEITKLIESSKESYKQASLVTAFLEEKKEDLVLPAQNNGLQEMIIIMMSQDELFFTVSCVQRRARKVTIRNNSKQYADKNLTVLCELETKPNAKNVWHRFKDFVRINKMTDKIQLLSTSFSLKAPGSLSPKEVIDHFKKVAYMYIECIKFEK